VENIEDIFGAMQVLLTMNEEQQQAIAEHIKTLKRQDKQLEWAAKSLPKVVETAVSEQMNLAAYLAQSAMNESLTPFLDRLNRDMDKITNRAAAENKQLNQAIHAFRWRWLWVASFATLTTSAAGALILSGYLELAWNRSELESLRTEKAVMVENIAALDKVKGHIKLDTCEGRPCVEVDGTGFTEGKKSFYWIKGVY
jgi:hypothetical protein